MQCPPLNELADYSRGLLAAAERAGIKTHLLTGCNNCLASLRWLDEVTSLTAQDRCLDFPEETIKGLVTWFKTQPAPQTVRKLIAHLIFDSLAPGQLAPVRAEASPGQGTTPTAGRQVLFQAAGYDIDLRFEEVEGEAVEDLIGQILPQSETQAVTTGLTVQLWRGEREQTSAQTDRQGLFRFARIPSGVYDLKIQVVEGEINLVRVATARAV